MLNAILIFWVSLVIQIIPFLLLGTILSSALHLFVKRETILRLLARHRLQGYLVAVFGGLLFPVCECVVVPLMMKLHAKGTPLGVAITFMLAAPIFNPIAIWSTVVAFSGTPQVVIWRLLLGGLVALIIGLWFDLKNPDTVLASPTGTSCTCEHEHVHEHHQHCNCEHHHDERGDVLVHNHHHHNHEKTKTSVLSAWFNLCTADFLEVLPYLVFGSLATSCLQALVPANVFATLGREPLITVPLIMVAAFVFSACSTSDAFIGKTFADRLSVPLTMPFLVFGPMLDLKSIGLLLARFQKAFVLKLAVAIVIVNLIIGIATAYLLPLW